MLIDTLVAGFPKMKEFVESLERQGVDETRRKVALGIYGANRLKYAKQWLEEKDARKIADEKKRKEEIELESLRLRKERNYVSWSALFVSLVSLAVSIYIALRT